MHWRLSKLVCAERAFCRRSRYLNWETEFATAQHCQLLAEVVVPSAAKLAAALASQCSRFCFSYARVLRVKGRFCHVLRKTLPWLDWLSWFKVVQRLVVPATWVFCCLSARSLFPSLCGGSCCNRWLELCPAPLVGIYENVWLAPSDRAVLPVFGVGE